MLIALGSRKGHVSSFLSLAQVLVALLLWLSVDDLVVSLTLQLAELLHQDALNSRLVGWKIFKSQFPAKNLTGLDE